MRLKIAGALSALTLMLSACDTYTSQQYQTSPQNVIELQQLSASGARASVGQVNLAENVEARPQCRLAGPLDLGGGNNVADTIKQAIQAEFLGGGLFSPNAKPINITVTQLKPDSFAGNWQINFLVSSQSGRSFKVNSTTEFSTSFTAVSACNNAATAFNRALGEAINAMVSNPNFRALI